MKALCESSPQARCHFTRLDQVHQLVTAREAIADTGFMARLLTLCSLPRTNPGHQLQYKRVNGPYTLIMTAVGQTELPFGNLPRLLLAWVCTEAVRTRSRKLVLGSSLSEFMRKLGIAPAGCARTRLRNQMKRLFNAHIQLAYEDKRVSASVNSPVASRTGFWWSERTPSELGLWDSKIELGEKFFHEIIRHPVPLDLNILKALKRSSLGLDLYLWLTYRTFSLKSPLRLSWARLYGQFGGTPAKAGDNRTVDYFRTDCLRELNKIKMAWPDLNCAAAKGVLILLPSKPAITHKVPSVRGISPHVPFAGTESYSGSSERARSGLFPSLGGQNALQIPADGFHPQDSVIRRSFPVPNTRIWGSIPCTKHPDIHVVNLKQKIYK